MKYRARANGNVVDLTPEAAALLVPTIYEAVEEAQDGPSTAVGVQPVKRPVGRPRKDQ